MKNNSIVPAHLAIRAMRDNGYKNAAYAIAELIDNSIQHGSTEVELICLEETIMLNSRNVSRIKKIAILDNGYGMDSKTLQMALQFGNGTHLDRDKQVGISKFGMGLPSSSISQAKKVEVWSWQKSSTSALYTYLDLDSIISKEMDEVPEPVKEKIPEIFKKMGKSFSESGTLVVWSNIDKCIWKTAGTIIDHSEFLIGRVYRKFLHNKKVKIRMAGYNYSNLKQPVIDRFAMPNDPLYLMDDTTCPEPYNCTPMFEKWGDDAKYYIKYDGKSHEVIVRFSVAKSEVRKGHNPGDKPFGKHAARNVGISLIRADRELDLDQSLTSPHDPRERWWGIEVDFPPTLDEVFGVTNNKQYANNFSDLARTILKEADANNVNISQLKQDMEDEGDSKSMLLDIVLKIESNLSSLRKLLRAQTEGARTKERFTREQIIELAEKKATEATDERRKSGIFGTSDEQEKESESERKEEVKLELEKEGVLDAEEITDFVFKNNLKYSINTADLESYAFFTVKPKGGKILISLNSNHPAYKKLIEALDQNEEGENNLRDRLKNASEGLKLLLMAWARYEDEQPDGSNKLRVQDSRQDWGRIAKEFLNED